MAPDGTVNFTGRYERSLDDKWRLTLPSAWRAKHDATQTFLAVRASGYIAVLPPDEVEKIRQQIKAIKLSNREAQAAANKFFSEAQAFSFDAAGRVMLDEALLVFAGIERDVVLMGSLTKFSIFSPARAAEEARLAQTPAARDALQILDI